MQFKIELDEATARRFVGIDFVTGGVAHLVAQQIEDQLPKVPEASGTLVSFHLDGVQYLVREHNRLRFLAASTDLERVKTADLVIKNYEVRKNRDAVIR